MPKRSFPSVPKRSIAIAGGVVGTLAIALVGGLLIFGGSDDGAATSITETPTTAAAVATTITAPPETTTSTALVEEVTTTNTPGVEIAVRFAENGGRLEVAVKDLYSWVGDPALEAPLMTEGLEDYFATARPTEAEVIQAQFSISSPYEQRLAVVTADDDVVLLVDEGETLGWKVVGAKLARYGLEASYGDAIRHVMIIGTDARPGQDQRVFRGDSLHILTSNIADGAGSILGFPRDSHVDAPYGGKDKFTHINALAGPDAVVQVARDLTGLPVEGYIVTGFLGFEQLVNDFGGVTVNVPFAMADPKSKAYLNAGSQVLWGANALAFTRNRSIYGSDFTRSFHHGLVIDGALDTVQSRGIVALPDLLRILGKYTWTDLSGEDLLTLAAGAYALDAESLINVVLPGTIQTIGGASVVVLNAEVEDYFRDLDDGILTEPAE